MSKQIIKEKFQILKDLHILSKCNKDEKARLKSCPNEIQLDNYAHMLIMKYL